MLFSTGSGSTCSFDPTVTSVNNLKSSSVNKDKELGSPDFGGWLALPPRKRRTKHHLVLDSDKIKPDKTQMKILKTDTYYKRYRVDPMEGTFKHYKNHGQYMQLYRETTTLCYKQKTLQELTAMYSAALDINSERGHTISGYTYNLDVEACRELGQAVSQTDILTANNIPPITSRTENGIPLMLIPTAPSIPSRLAHQTQSSIGSASFMCNAYMNRSIVCPVHRIIHRKSSLLNVNGRSRSHVDLCPDEHIKVTLPGIPKRSSQVIAPPIPSIKGSRSTPHSTYNLVEDEEEDSDARINNLLSSNNHHSPSERVSKALHQQKRLVPCMQLPVTALLQYSPKFQDATNRQVKIKKHLSLKNRQSRLMESKKKLVQEKPKPEVKQVIETQANKPLKCKSFSGIGESCLRVSSVSAENYWVCYKHT